MKAIIVFRERPATPAVERAQAAVTDWMSGDVSLPLVLSGGAIVHIYDDEWRLVVRSPEPEAVTTTLESVDMDRDTGLYLLAAVQLLALAFLVWWVVLR